MRKKPPGEKNVSTGVSLPPDLYEWVMNRVKEPSADPTSARTASKIVKQALIEYRERIEKDEAAAREAAERPEGKAQRAARKAVDAGAKTISPSASFATSSSTDGKVRYPKAG